MFQIYIICLFGILNVLVADEYYVPILFRDYIYHNLTDSVKSIFASVNREYVTWYIFKYCLYNIIYYKHARLSFLSQPGDDRTEIRV